MAHELDMSNGRANMAYTGPVPWHGLGQEIDPDASIDKWRVAAGLNWSVKDTPDQYTVGKQTYPVPNSRILYRSDTKGYLGTVSGNRYKVVQPEEILEFYRDLVDEGQFTMETAGSLKEGQVVWALAKTNQEFRIMGQDLVKGYLLLTTGIGNNLPTRAQFTTVRVVCNNTLQMSLTADSGATIRHCSDFIPDQVKAHLGIGKVLFKDFKDQAQEMAKVKLKDKEAMEFIVKVMNDTDKVDLDNIKSPRPIKQVFELYQGQGMGSNLRSANGTLWGAVNAVTEFLDHHKGYNSENRVASSFTGQNQTKKDRLLTVAYNKLAA